MVSKLDWKAISEGDMGALFGFAETNFHNFALLNIWCLGGIILIELRFTSDQDPVCLMVNPECRRAQHDILPLGDPKDNRNIKTFDANIYDNIRWSFVDEGMTLGKAILIYSPRCYLLNSILAFSQPAANSRD